jgi:curli biogenesis system outer membrane secretion channel CsgG
MRRIVLAGAVFFFFMLLAIPGTAATASLKAEAIRKLQSAVVKALPAEGSIIRIAILDLAGDDGAVKNAITAIITEKTSFKVIERADLDMILKEQGLQLKDVMDEKTRIQHGKLKGVQGLLMGKVLGMESGFMSYTVRIHLKLDDVEKGEIVFARDFNVTAVSPVRAWIFIIAGLVLLIIVVAIVWGRRRSAIKETVIQADVKERVDLGRGVGRALSTLSEARAKLMDQGKTDAAVALKDAERNLLALKEQIENAARGSSDMKTREELNEALEFDRKFLETSEALAKSADGLYEAVSAGAAGLDQRIDLVKRDIRVAADAFRRRKI